MFKQNHQERRVLMLSQRTDAIKGPTVGFERQCVLGVTAIQVQIPELCEEVASDQPIRNSALGCYVLMM